MKKLLFFLSLFCLGTSLSYGQIKIIPKPTKKKSKVKKGFYKKKYGQSKFRPGTTFFSKKFRYYTIGATASTANYFGEIAPNTGFVSTDLSKTRPSFGVTGSKVIYPHFSVRAGLNWARLEGSDASSNSHFSEPRFRRNQNFRNDIKELSVVGVYDFIANRDRYRRRVNFTPYVFGGLGVFYHNPRTFYNGDLIPKGWYDLQPLRTEGQEKPYSKIQLSVPLGFGFRYKFNSQIDFSIETSVRKTFTDYLDDISGRYADKGLLNQQSGKEAWVLSDRSIDVPDVIVKQYVGKDGNTYPYTDAHGRARNIRGHSSNDDWYVLTGFRVSYIIDPYKYRGGQFR